MLTRSSTTVVELIACVRRANENAGNLIIKINYIGDYFFALIDVGWGTNKALITVNVWEFCQL